MAILASWRALLQDTAKATDYSIEAIEDMAVALIEQTIANLKAGKRVYLKELGTLKPVRVQARKRHNPYDGTQMTIPAHKRLKFRAAPELAAVFKPKVKKIGGNNEDAKTEENDEGK